MEHLVKLGADINGIDETRGPDGCDIPLHYAAGIWLYGCTCCYGADLEMAR
jgi:hypothetical protein